MAGILAAGALVAGTLLAGLPSLAPAAAEPTTPTEAALRLTGMSPVVPRVDDVITWRGDLANRTSRDWDALTLEVRVAGTPLLGRLALAGWMEGAGPDTTRLVRSQRLSGTRAGGISGWTLTVPAADLPLATTAGGTGVYGIEFRVTGLPGAQSVATARSLLVWAPVADAMKPSSVVIVVPLTWTPSRLEDGRFGDDLLLREITSNGRLGRLITAGTGRGIDWVVDPSLLEAVADLADGARVPDLTAEDGTRDLTPEEQATAAAFLDRVRASVLRVHVLPAGGADAVAMLAAKDLAGVRLATALGVSTVTRLLGRSPAGTVAWAASGIDAAVATRAQRAGIDVLLAPDAALPPAAGLFFTPSGIVGEPSGTGGTRVVLWDGTLSTAASTTADPWTLIADAAMVTMELPQAPRTVVLALDPATADATTFERALTALADARTRRVMLMRSLAGFTSMARSDIPRAEGRYPAEGLVPPLPGQYLAAVARLRERAEAVAALGATPDVAATVRASLLAGVEGATSQRWTLDVAGRDAHLAALGDLLRGYETGLQLIGSERVTLSGERGVIPLTLVNELPFPARVGLAVQPSSTVRLLMEGTSPIVTVAPGERLGVELRTRVVGSGPVSVKVRARTLDGRLVGDAISVEVGTAAYARVATWIVAVSFVLLSLLVLRNTLRRIRAGREGGAA